jgi:PAS domain S-box-containing protein
MSPHTDQDRIASIIFDSIGEGVFTTDGNCRITSFNRAAEKISGFRRAEAIGKFCFDIFRTELCSERCALRTTLESDEEVRNVRVSIITRDGRKVPISVSTSVLRGEDGAHIGAVEFFRDISEVEHLERRIKHITGVGNLVSANEQMQRIFALLPDIAKSECSVLIQGPSGTGKELIAQALHDLSPRGRGPFVKINCGALPENLLESELFGYERGAFTDARRSKPGQFRIAHSGTLLLDEIGEMPVPLQVKLFRVLSSGEFSPLGSVEVQKVDTRIIACTNRNLEQMIEEGLFREELFYRVNVVNICLPALRERPEDIPLLVDHFVARFREKRGKDITGVSRDVLALLRSYDFPGNVRELENAIEHAFVICRGDLIEREHLPQRIAQFVKLASGTGIREQSEKAIIREALVRNRGNRQATSVELGMHRSTLWRKLRQYGLDA